jgi:hypothetical protein
VSETEELPEDMTLEDWLGPAGNFLMFWKDENDDHNTLSAPLLEAVRELELEVLRRGQDVLEGTMV